MDTMDRHVFDDRYQSVTRERDVYRHVDGHLILHNNFRHLHVDCPHMRHFREVSHVVLDVGALQASEQKDRAERVVGREAAKRDQDLGRENSSFNALRRPESLR